MIEIQKPKIGEPCNGCGICCKTQVCRNGAYILKLVTKLGDTVVGPCPALKFTDNQYKCDVVMFPKKYINSSHDANKLREAFKFVIGSGTGCDELGDDYTEDEADKLDAIIEQCKGDENFIINAKKAMKVLYNI